jgi:phenylalanyl-tRNA synthetase beta chain
LRRAGVRPISLIVDTTNYIMLSLGQPLHAYDFDTLKLPIGVRLAKQGEELRTLDGKLRKLCSGDDIVITDSADNSIGLAGVMGGMETEVTDSTTNVLIEAANFEQFHIARTARRHKLHSEAAFRFERGVDTNLQVAAAQAAVDLLVKYGSGVVDDAVQDANFVKPREAIEYKTSTTSRLLGIYLPTSKVKELLEEIGCEVEAVGSASAGESASAASASAASAGAESVGSVGLGSASSGSAGEMLSVTPPSWRPDLTIEADLAEEIARLSGYDKIPSSLPPVTSSGDNKLSKNASFKRLVSSYLASNSLVEVLSYPFVGESELETVVLPGLDDVDDASKGVEAVELENPLSKDKPYLRTVLLQSLLETANRNVRRTNAGIQLFEVGKVFIPNEYTNNSRSHLLGGFRPDDLQLDELNRGLPYQPIRLAGVFTGEISLKTYSKDAVFADYENAFLAAKGIINLAKIDAQASPDVPNFFHPGRSAKYAVAVGDGTQKTIGYAGELHPNVINKLHLPKRTSVFEFSLDLLFELSAKTEVQAKPISTYPAVKEDFAFVVDRKLPAAKLIGVAKESVGDILEDINIFDVFESGAIGEGKKSIAFSVKIRPQEKTFDENDIHAVRDRLIRSIEGELGAELRS